MPQNTFRGDSLLTNKGVAYKERLHNWVIVRLLPNMQRVIVGRFRSRSDADGHLQCLRQLLPTAAFVLVFDSQRQL